MNFSANTHSMKLTLGYVYLDLWGSYESGYKSGVLQMMCLVFLISGLVHNGFEFVEQSFLIFVKTVVFRHTIVLEDHCRIELIRG